MEPPQFCVRGNSGAKCESSSVNCWSFTKFVSCVSIRSEVLGRRTCWHISEITFQPLSSCCFPGTNGLHHSTLMLAPWCNDRWAVSIPQLLLWVVSISDRDLWAGSLRIAIQWPKICGRSDLLAIKVVHTFHSRCELHSIFVATSEMKLVAVYSIMQNTSKRIMYQLVQWRWQLGKGWKVFCRHVPQPRNYGRIETWLVDLINEQ